MTQEQEFLVAQKAFIEKDGSILVLFDDRGLDFPGGKIQENELDLEASLRREVHEETGLTIAIEQTFTTWLYTFEEGDTLNTHHLRHRFFVGYICKHISGEVTLSQEHLKYEWVNKENYRKAIDSVERDIFCDVLERYFTH